MPESCFAGSLLELALAADRRYMLDDAKRPVHVQASAMNGQVLLDGERACRGSSAFSATRSRSCPACDDEGRSTPNEADEAGLVTVLADDIDFDDTCASRSKSARRSRPTR